MQAKVGEANEEDAKHLQYLVLISQAAFSIQSFNLQVLLYGGGGPSIHHRGLHLRPHPLALGSSDSLF